MKRIEKFLRPLSLSTVNLKKALLVPKLQRRRIKQLIQGKAEYGRRHSHPYMKEKNRLRHVRGLFFSFKGREHRPAVFSGRGGGLKAIGLRERPGKPEREKINGLPGYIPNSLSCLSCTGGYTRLISYSPQSGSGQPARSPSSRPSAYFPAPGDRSPTLRRSFHLPPTPPPGGSHR